MKTNRLQTLAGIITESQSPIHEGKLVNAKFYGLWQSEDGSKSGSPNIYIEANSEEEAKELANDYTDGQFTKYSGFYNLLPVGIKIYRKSI